MIKTQADLKRELSKLGIKTYRNKKDGRSYISKADAQRVVAQMSPEELVDEINDAEERNDSWAIVILIADFLGASEYKQVAETMSDIQDRVFGSRPPGFDEFRSYLLSLLGKNISNKIDDKDLLEQVKRHTK